MSKLSRQNKSRIAPELLDRIKRLKAELKTLSRTWKTKFELASKTKEQIHHAQHAIPLHRKFYNTEFIANLPLQEAARIAKLSLKPYAPLSLDRFRQSTGLPCPDEMERSVKKI